MIDTNDFHDDLGENHIATSAKNPVRDDAFDISDERKIELIKKMLKIFFIHWEWTCLMTA